MGAGNALRTTIEETVPDRAAARFGDAADRPRCRGAPVPEGISEDDLFTVLKNERRRRVLDILDRDDGSTTLSTLAERIAARENGIDTTQLDSQQRKRVYVALYQRHLPRMDDLGVVEYDQRSGRVTVTDCGRSLWTWRNRTLAGGAPAGAAGGWPKLYIAICLAGSLGLAVSYAGSLPPALSTTTVATAVFLSAVAQACTRDGSP